MKAGELRLTDLVANRTMSEDIVRTLRKAIAAKSSFLVVAKPRMAGKSTVMNAMLAELPAGTPVRTLGADGLDVAKLANEANGGYLIVPEITTHNVMPGYVWGEPVKRAFATNGCSLASTLHADAAEDALAQVRECGVPDRDIARLALIVHLRSLGDDWEHPTRRVVAHVHALEGGKTRLLHRWDEPADRFL